MLEYVKYFHNAYKEFKDEKDSNAFLINYIVSEAKYNNDIANIILSTYRKKGFEPVSNLLLSLELYSQDILTSLGKTIEQVFHDEIKETPDIDIAKNTKDYYCSRSPSELYEAYIRKAKALKTFAEQGVDFTELSIKFPTRIQNIAHATRYLSNKRGQ